MSTLLQLRVSWWSDISLIISKVLFAHEDQGQDDMKTLSNISVKITDWESGVEYGSVLFDGQSNSDDCYHHLTYKVSCYP